MFDTRILSLCIFADQDCVHIVVRGLITLDRRAWSYVGEKVECSTQCQVQRHVPLANYKIYQSQNGAYRSHGN
jgi:hypothetical protein